MVRAIMIVEMAGRPAEYLTESLEKHVGILRDVSDIEVYEIRVSEPRVIAQSEGKNISGNENGEEIFTAFAECDFEVPNFARLSETMFDFMPSSVEVVEPGVVSLEMIEATDLLNNISGRMHRYDEIAKIAGERLKTLVSQMQSMQRILISRDKEIAGLKEKLGIEEKALGGKDMKEKKGSNKVVKKRKASSKKKA